MEVQRKRRATVYYCIMEQRKLRPGGEYHREQRRIAEWILNYDLTNKFGAGNQIEKRYGEHGKPYLCGVNGYFYNVSHTDGLVVCAVGDVPLGADAEREKEIKKNVLPKCCTLREQEYIQGGGNSRERDSRFFRLWTLKESYIKMTGEGMTVPLTGVEFQMGEGRDIRCSQRGQFCQRKEGEYWISLCTEEEAEISWREIFPE